MDTKQVCMECGAPLAADAPQGLCPNCLMKVAMGSEAGKPAAGSGERKPALPPEEIAKHFPQFEILALLGQGGMGAVYKARQPGLDRFVALKILPAQAAADVGFAERFNREARALAKLSHPNIVAVYDFGHVDGLHYLVMEYVDGLNLRQLQQTGRLPPREALQIIPQICEALQFAHDEGVVHRDIKPENVLLDKKGRVKIADFGLARILGREPETFRLTGVKDLMGTPHYMAPEQIEHPQAVDHRADIYSLGVVFYEMLTGELPLGKFQPPSKKVQVDVRLDEVVLHALEKEPERRYQHVSEVKSDVETIAHTPDSDAALPAGSDGAQEIERVRRQVKGPAIGLLVTGILNWILMPAIALLLLPNAMHSAKEAEFPQIVVLCLALVPLVLCSFIIYAALKMMQLERRGAAIAASVFAMLVTPGNLIGLPMGIWALVVLSHREVRQAFGKRHPLPLPPDKSPHASHGSVAWKVAAVVGAMVVLMLLAVSVIALLWFTTRADKARDQARRAQAAAVAERTALSNLASRPMNVAESPELRATREKLAALRKMYTDEHPSVQALLHRIDELEQQADRSRSSSSFGPIIEQVLYSVTAQRPIRLLDLDSGEQIELPVEREKGTEEQFFFWISEHGVDLMAQGHRAAWTLTTSLKLASLEETAWSGATPATLREALMTGTNALRRMDKVFGHDQYLLETNTALPLSFAFQTRQGGLGALQITGFNDDPPGVKLRYKLVQRGSTAYGAPAPQGKPDDVADVPSAAHFAGVDTNKLYFLVDRLDRATGGKNPRPLLLVLPGGDGGRDFSPFIKRIYKNALPERYLVAQLVAPKWDENQFAQLVWPTEKSRYPAMKFSTEEFVNAVVADIEKTHPLDAKRIFTLSWSSGGPAGYAISLHPDTRVAGSFIAMSIFKPDQLPDAANAKGQAYYLLHSPQDFIPKRMPELARDTLTSHGAKVHLQTYQGGHGWHGDVYGMIGEGIRWLEQQTTSRSAPPVEADPAQPVALKAGETLPFKNIGMEEGSDNPAAWQKGSPVAGVEQMWDRATAHGGKGSLCLKKTVQRYFPIAQWSQTVMVEPAEKVRKLKVRCWVKTQNVTKAIIDVTYQGKQSGHVWAVFLGQKKQTDPVATHDWKLCEGIVEVPAQTSRLGIAFQIYGPGAVWFDDLEVAWVE